MTCCMVKNSRLPIGNHLIETFAMHVRPSALGSNRMGLMVIEVSTALSVCSLSKHYQLIDFWGDFFSFCLEDPSILFFYLDLSPTEDLKVSGPELIYSSDCALFVFFWLLSYCLTHGPIHSSCQLNIGHAPTPEITILS